MSIFLTLTRKRKIIAKQFYDAFYVPGRENFNPLISRCSLLQKQKGAIKNGKEFYTVAKIVHPRQAFKEMLSDTYSVTPQLLSIIDSGFVLFFFCVASAFIADGLRPHK